VTSKSNSPVPQVEPHPGGRERTPVASELQVQCLHAELCPGCPAIRDNYGAQLAKKTERLKRAIAGFDELAQIEVIETAPAARVEAYRTRAKLVVDAHGALGLFARGSHEVIDLPECRVLDASLSRVASTLRTLLGAPGLAGVDLAHVGDAVMVTLIADDGAPREPLERLAHALAQAEPGVTSVALSHRRANAVQLLGGRHELLLGENELRARSPVSGTYHYAAHGAFQQVHADTATAIYGRVLAQVRAHFAGSAFLAAAPQGTRRPRVLELYAGSGALALELAAQGASVLAVESFPPACERLERAASEQKLPLQVRVGDAAEVLRQLRTQGEQFDLVIVNPPRRGLDLEVRRALGELKPAHLAYVSCNPATLARDLAQLARLGLATHTLEPFDMMPLTEQVETLAWLSATPTPAPAVLFSEGALLAVNKPPHEPTTPQGEYRGSLLQRVQALPGYERAVPLHRLDVGTSGVCLFSRTPEQAGQLAAALSSATKTYLALAKGVVHKRGRIEKPIVEAGRSLEARTRYERLQVVRGHSFVRVHIDTGRTHQIRKHFAGIGHPVLGDARYGDRPTQAHFTMRHGLDRPFLHCHRMALTLEGREVAIEAPLAADLERVLESLRQLISGA
jgi:23S rRNA (uracil1939-C5)-methyltransferase